jgi:hypothetical protein
MHSCAYVILLQGWRHASMLTVGTACLHKGCPFLLRATFPEQVSPLRLYRRLCILAAASCTHAAAAALLPAALQLEPGEGARPRAEIAWGRCARLQLLAQPRTAERRAGTSSCHQRQRSARLPALLRSICTDGPCDRQACSFIHGMLLIPAKFAVLRSSALSHLFRLCTLQAQAVVNGEVNELLNWL